MKTRTINTVEELNEFQMFMKQFWASFKSDNTSPEQTAIYVQDLAELPLEDLKQACKQLRRKQTFLPSIAEVYAEVEQIQKKAEEKRLLANPRDPRLKEFTLQERMAWKKEGIPDDIAAQLPGWKSLLKKMSMSQRVSEVAGENYEN